MNLPERDSPNKARFAAALDALVVAAKDDARTLAGLSAAAQERAEAKAATAIDVLFLYTQGFAERYPGSMARTRGNSVIVEASARVFLESPARFDDFDTDTLALIVAHYLETVQSGRVPGLGLFHYADMLRDGRGTVRRMAEAAGIDAALVPTSSARVIVSIWLGVRE